VQAHPSSAEARREALSPEAALATLAELATHNPLLARTSEAERLVLYRETAGKPLLLRWTAGQLGRGHCVSFTDALHFIRSCPEGNDPLEFIFGDLVEDFSDVETKVLCALTYFTLPAKVEHITAIAGVEGDTAGSQGAHAEVQRDTAQADGNAARVEKGAHASLRAVSGIPAGNIPPAGEAARPMRGAARESEEMSSAGMPKTARKDACAPLSLAAIGGALKSLVNRSLVVPTDEFQSLVISAAAELPEGLVLGADLIAKRDLPALQDASDVVPAIKGDHRAGLGAGDGGRDDLPGGFLLPFHARTDGGHIERDGGEVLRLREQFPPVLIRAAGEVDVERGCVEVVGVLPLRSAGGRDEGAELFRVEPAGDAAALADGDEFADRRADFLVAKYHAIEAVVGKRVRNFPCAEVDVRGMHRGDRRLGRFRPHRGEHGLHRCVFWRRLCGRCSVREAAEQKRDAQGCEAVRPAGDGGGDCRDR